jgi:arylsulfatase A-like enzyme
LPAAEAPSRPPARPNVVLIFCDDMGYADVGCYGAKNIETPNLDHLAREGVRFTDFCVAQAVCSASRAALMTGCYPNRVGIFGALGPRVQLGLRTNEITIAEVLKSRGFATAIYGKWHLGRPVEFLPKRQGFDDYFGLPYSNDMWPHHPTGGTNYPPLPLIAGDEVAQLMPDQTQLTTWYTERAVNFIEQHKAQPFFLYVAHSMPHVPLFVSDKFKGKSPRGLYGDVIMEIDWSVGEVLKALRAHQLEEKTLVIFTSDNGPWLLYGNHAGSAGPLREGKGTSFDGGVRVPCMMRWPGQIPAGLVCRELATTMDLLPTLARLAGAELPKDRILDGKDIWPLISGQPGAKSPHEAFFYYWARHLQAVRSGPWKLHFPHSYPQPNPPGADGKPGKMATQKIELALYDLEEDIGETNNVAVQHPEVVQRLQALADRCRDDLGDSAMRRTGRNIRLPGRTPAVPVPQPHEGAIILHASEATVHGTTVRYEPQPHKNTIGFWTKAEDWVSWDFQVPQAGAFLVEILQGCGQGSGGSEVEFSVGPQTLRAKVEETGGFQNFVSRHIGKLTFDQPGRYTLSVKPLTKPGPAVMDLRLVAFWPVEN